MAYHFPHAGRSAAVETVFDLNFRDGIYTTPAGLTDDLDALMPSTTGAGRFALDRNGIFQPVPANTNRIAFDPITGRRRGLAWEGAATRRSTDPANLATSSWSRTNLSVDGYSAFSPVTSSDSATILRETADNGNHFVIQYIPLAAGTRNAITTIVKPAGRTRGRLQLGGNAGTPVLVDFDLATGTMINRSTGADVAGRMRPIGHGYYRIDLSALSLAGSTVSFLLLFFADDSGNYSYAGDPAKGMAVAYLGMTSPSDATSFAASSPILAVSPRPADNPKLDMGAVPPSTYHTYDGTIFCRAALDSPDSTVGTIFAIRGSDTSNGIWAFANFTGGNLLSVVVRYNNVDQTVSVPGIGAPGVFQFALSYKAGETKLVLQGGTVVTLAAGNPPPSMRYIDFGHFNGLKPGHGVIEHFVYQNGAANDDRLRALVG